MNGLDMLFFFGGGGGRNAFMRGKESLERHSEEKAK